MTIVFPKNWATLGKPVSSAKIGKRLRVILKNIPCNNLAYSGGIDSSLLLFYLLANGKKVNTFTITSDQNHPDNEYSIKGIEYYTKIFGKECINGHWFTRPKSGVGDDLVKVFYQILPAWCNGIIAGDGIDEYMGGYYKHQEIATEDCYFKILRSLHNENLKPLNENSGSIKVYLPYLDEKLVSLFSQIPLSEKVSNSGRKLLIVDLAKGKIPEDIINRRKYGFATKP